MMLWTLKVATILILCQVVCRISGSTCPTGCECSPKFRSISCNGLKSVDADFPTEAAYITIDNLNGPINSGAFMSMPNVHTITINASDIRSIETNAFWNLTNSIRKKILIHHSSIGQIETGAFSKVHNVERFDFHSLDIQQIDSLAFNDIGDVSYFTVYLTNFTTLPSKFINAQNIDRMVLYHVNMAKLDTNTFGALYDVREMHLFSSTIRHMRPFSGLSNIQSLTLELLTLHNLAPGFLELKNVGSTSFLKNTIYSMPCDIAPIGTDSLTAYSNEITCSCGLQWTKTTEKDDSLINSLTCEGDLGGSIAEYLEDATCGPVNHAPDGEIDACDWDRNINDYTTEDNSHSIKTSHINGGLVPTLQPSTVNTTTEQVDSGWPQFGSNTLERETGLRPHIVKVDKVKHGNGMNTPTVIAIVIVTIVMVTVAIAITIWAVLKMRQKTLQSSIV